MARTVKHVSLHRINGTELRVVSDVETDVICAVHEEEAVIRGYMSQGIWPHRFVSLFVLHDLQPLIRQLRQQPAALEGLENLEQRPVVNIYDLNDRKSCHVYVNRQVMDKHGYCGDAIATRGLLAHEHAHPLAENDTTRASRGLRIEVSLAGGNERIQQVLCGLIEELCVLGPREVFTNELVIRSGFDQSLLHLNRLNLTEAVQSISGRIVLQRQLQDQVVSGSLKPEEANAILLIGDLKSHLNLAMEVAPFYRVGRNQEADELESILRADLLPHLEKTVTDVYRGLVEHYVRLRPDQSAGAVGDWAEGLVGSLAGTLRRSGLDIDYQITVSEPV